MPWKAGIREGRVPGMSSIYDATHIEDLDEEIEFCLSDLERCRDKISDHRVRLRSLNEWHQCLLVEKKRRGE